MGGVLDRGRESRTRTVLLQASFAGCTLPLSGAFEPAGRLPPGALEPARGALRFASGLSSIFWDHAIRMVALLAKSVCLAFVSSSGAIEPARNLPEPSSRPVAAAFRGL